MESMPLLRVSRPVSACLRCRSAKVRCDGKLPACTACERAGKAHECSSAQDLFAPGKERSYVAALEARIETLERQLAELPSRSASSTTTTRGNSSLANPEPAAPVHEAHDVEDLVSGFGYLSINATASGYQGFIKEMSFARLVLCMALRLDLLSAGAWPLPVKPEGRALIHEALRQDVALYPVITETAVHGSFEAVYSHDGRFAGPADRWSMRLLFALALLARSRAHGDLAYDSAIRHVRVALADQEAIIQPGSVAAVQAILLLVLVALREPNHLSAWYLIGLATRVIVDIGLHQDAQGNHAPGTRALEHRRRVFNCAYSLDRAISFTRVRAFSFSDDSVNVTPPTITNPILNPNTHTLTGVFCNDSRFLRMLHLRKALSRLYQATFRDDRKRQTESLALRLPRLRKAQEALTRLIAGASLAEQPLLHCEFAFVCMLVVRPSPTPSEADRSSILNWTCGYAATFAHYLLILCHTPQYDHLCTHLELSRAIWVSQHLSSLLVDSRGMAESSTMRFTVAARPQLPEYSPNATMATPVRTLTQLTAILDQLGRRYGQEAELQDAKRVIAAALDSSSQALHKSLDNLTRT